MHYLVTGGAGFIGHHLNKALLKQGHQVTVVDDLSTGSLKNLEDLETFPNFSYHLNTILNRELMEELVASCDMVVHLAAAVGVQLIVDRPVQVIETNILGSEIVLSLAHKYHKKIFIASTSEVYGKNSNPSFSEEDDMVMGSVMRHRWSYACSKAIDEFLALAYHKEYNLPVIIGRFFNTIGPGQTGRYGMVVPRFMAQAIAGKPITIYGDGNQTRCFTFVGDVVEALLRLFNEPAAVGQVVNIGNDQSISIKKLAEKIKVLTGSTSPVEYIPYEQAYNKGFEDMMHRKPDISKLEKLIGFRPYTPLDQILEQIQLSLQKHDTVIH